MHHRLGPRHLVVAAALLAVTPAAAAAHAGAAATTQKVKLRFAAVAGSTPVSCGETVPGLGTTKADAQLLDLRFFASDVRLHEANGRSVRVKLARNAFQTTKGRHGVTLIDLEDGTGGCADGTPQTNALVRGTVPKGRYTGASWTVGVPFALNHTDAPTAAAPLNSTAMAWSWQVGRKFTKIEVGAPAQAMWSAPAFLVHLGSTGCTGNPATGQTVECAAANRPKVRLARIDAGKQDVAVDLRALLAGNDVTANQGDAPGCMSGPTDPECVGVFGAFGLPFDASGVQQGGGMDMGGMDMGGMSHAATPRQTVFRAVRK